MKTCPYCRAYYNDTETRCLICERFLVKAIKIVVKTFSSDPRYPPFHEDLRG